MKHRALVIGAGRIGAGFNWHDNEYTHAGAYRALSDRVELVGFVEPDLERRVKANLKWNVPTYDNVAIALAALKPDILSICTQPNQQKETYLSINWTGIKGVWQEKPFQLVSEPGCWQEKPFSDGLKVSIQVNYMRRGDADHQVIANYDSGGTLIVYGKDDIHTRCHFEDLRDWWKCSLDFRVFNGPCAYVYRSKDDEIGDEFFDNGGVDGGKCFKAMLGNLLDHVDNGTPLWSPAR